jgi:hypothetical protein
MGALKRGDVDFKVAELLNRDVLKHVPDAGILDVKRPPNIAARRSIPRWRLQIA